MVKPDSRPAVTLPKLARSGVSGGWRSENGVDMRISGAMRPKALIASKYHDLIRRDRNVTKSEFVDQVASRADLGKAEAGKAVDAVLDTIQETLQRGSDVTFSGFGKFHVAERGARQGVHPRTGEPIQIAASKVPRFTAGSGLKKAVNG
jgi:DNA-binding protein HU-beta